MEVLKRDEIYNISVLLDSVTLARLLLVPYVGEVINTFIDNQYFWYERVEVRLGLVVYDREKSSQFSQRFENIAEEARQTYYDLENALKSDNQVLYAVKVHNALALLILLQNGYDPSKYINEYGMGLDYSRDAFRLAYVTAVDFNSKEFALSGETGEDDRSILSILLNNRRCDLFTSVYIIDSMLRDEYYTTVLRSRVNDALAGMVMGYFEITTPGIDQVLGEFVYSEEMSSDLYLTYLLQLSTVHTRLTTEERLDKYREIANQAPGGFSFEKAYENYLHSNNEPLPEYERSFYCTIDAFCFLKDNPESSLKDVIVYLEDKLQYNSYDILTASLLIGTHLGESALVERGYIVTREIREYIDDTLNIDLRLLLDQA